jgi:hypothetical protein
MHRIGGKYTWAMGAFGQVFEDFRKGAFFGGADDRCDVAHFGILVHWVSGLDLVCRLDNHHNAGEK